MKTFCLHFWKKCKHGQDLKIRFIFPRNRRWTWSASDISINAHILTCKNTFTHVYVLTFFFIANTAWYHWTHDNQCKKIVRPNLIRESSRRVWRKDFKTAGSKCKKTCMQTYKHAYVHAYYIYMYIDILYEYVGTYTLLHTCTHTYIHICLYTNIYMYIHSVMHTHKKPSYLTNTFYA